ncbi:MAG: dihydroorotate dehydrogenase-like protein [Spirochaetota bacterium]|nr:MAG: dihydroorotate dehydrogenase-like protein [Spirochaetota bacterium]
MADLKTIYMGMELKNPVIAGSSGITNNVENLKKIEKHGAGAVVLKSIFEEQILYESDQEVEASDLGLHPEAMGYLSTMTKEHSVYNYLSLIEEAKKVVSIPVIASVNCLTDGEWTTFAKRIQDAGADALELNVLITDYKDNDSKSIENKYFKIAEKVKKIVSIPFALKLSILFSNIPQMLTGLSRSGVSGLVLFNRYWSPDVDLDEMAITSGSIYSSPEEIVTPIRWIGLMSELIECDISASTGAHDGNSVIKLIAVGATTVQVCSALYLNGIEYIEKIVKQVNDWLDSHGYKSVDDIRDILGPKTHEERKVFGRVQFMKYYTLKK